MQPVFPREITSTVPRITLTGQEMMLIEQHRGLAAYSADGIELRVSCGTLRIAGEELRFLRYTAQEAEIAGCISSVSFVREGKK